MPNYLFEWSLKGLSKEVLARCLVMSSFATLCLLVEDPEKVTALDPLLPLTSPTDIPCGKKTITIFFH